ncbi:MAG: hypothetical protein ACRDNK_03055 [Solirubrobacteraceae bacterium]
MRVEASRLRRGEVIAAAGAVVLLVSLFLLSWYGLSGAVQRSAAALGIATTISGWDALTDLRWLFLVTAIVGLALAFAQATSRAPAFPASLSVITTVLGGLASLTLVYRVLINVPGPSDLVGARAGAYLGLIGALALTAGAFLSLREEDPPDPVREAAIETVHVH